MQIGRGAHARLADGRDVTGRAVLLPRIGPFVIGSSPDADCDLIIDAPGLAARSVKLEVVHGSSRGRVARYEPAVDCQTFAEMRYAWSLWMACLPLQVHDIFMNRNSLTAMNLGRMLNVLNHAVAWTPSSSAWSSTSSTLLLL